MKKILQYGFTLCLSAILFCSIAVAEEDSTSAKKSHPDPVIEAMPETPTIKELAEKEQHDAQVLRELRDAPASGPFDEYNRSTPRSSLASLALAVKDQDYERAVHFLDLRNLPFSAEKELDGVELVQQLVVVAKRVMTIDFHLISDDPLGHTDDGLPSYRDRVTTLKTKNGPVDILMQRVPRGDGVYIWKISNATVAIIPELNEEFGYGVIGTKLSRFFPHYVVFGFELWQIILSICLLLASYVCAYILTFILQKLVKSNKRFNKQRLQDFITGPLRFLLLIVIFRSSFDLITPSLTARALFEAQTFLLLAIYWVLLGVVDLVFYRLADRMRSNGQQDAIVLLRPASTGVKLTVALLIVIAWLDNLGYQVTTILAGLGVGGIAVALAAQKSLENLLGAITIYASHPVRVGDLCKFEDSFGVVEEIGLRATQLRTLARTIVYIPNAAFAAGKIENLSQRDKILYRTRLRLSFEDSPDKVKQVLAGIRSMIEEDELIETDGSRVQFFEFGEYAQELELYVYIKTNDFKVYLEQREVINLRLGDIVEAAGATMVVPTRASYIKEIQEKVES